MTAHVNENCIGCGLCTGISPDVFTMTDEGTAAAGRDFPGAGASGPGGGGELPGERDRGELRDRQAGVKKDSPQLQNCGLSFGH